MTIDKQTTAPASGVHTSNGSAHSDVQHAPVGDMPENPLSEREMEVARLLVTGATNVEIANALVISPHTVKVHLRNVFDKLQVSSRTEASMLLVQRGWVVIPGVMLEAEVAPVEDAGPAIPEPEPLENLEAQPRPWQLATLLFGVAMALVTLFLPVWNTTPKSSVGLLSDSGQTIVGKPVLNNLPSRWEIQPPLSQPRSRMAAVGVAGQIYVVGGEGEEGETLDLVEIYDLERGQWRRGAPLPSPRANLALAAGGDDLIVAGGSRIDNEAPNGILLYDDLARYDRDADRWTTGGKLPLALAGAALVVQDEAIYLLGGWNGQAVQDRLWRLPLEQVDSASPEDWEVVTHLPIPAAWFGAVLVNDVIYVAGGYDGRHELAEFAAYTIPSGEWQRLTSLSTPRGGVSLVYDGMTILALGGGWTRTIQNHERYDALTNQWTTIDTPVAGEWRHFGAAANNGSVYMLGGWSGAYLDTHLQFQSTFRALLPVIPNARDEN